MNGEPLTSEERSARKLFHWPYIVFARDIAAAYNWDLTPVCTENSVRIDYVTESPNVSGDDRSVLPLPGLVRLAVQVEEPT